MGLQSGCAMAVVLERIVVSWIRGSVEAPNCGCSCEHFDDPTGTRGFNSIGILLLPPQMIEILTLRWNEESNASIFFLRVCDLLLVSDNNLPGKREEEAG